MLKEGGGVVVGLLLSHEQTFQNNYILMLGCMYLDGKLLCS